MITELSFKTCSSKDNEGIKWDVKDHCNYTQHWHDANFSKSIGVCYIIIGSNSIIKLSS